MWLQQSKAELNTLSQNNGQRTYNRAPHLPPDHIGDTLLHKHGLHGAGATAEDGSLFLALRGARPSGNPFVALFALIGFIAAAPWCSSQVEKFIQVIHQLPR